MNHMVIQPVIKTRRLLLRPFVAEDAAQVRLLAGDERIADVTARIPHPYPEGLAEEWIAGHSSAWSRRELATFAMVLKKANELIGCLSLMKIKGDQAELGYWVGVEFWNKGYCTEACRCLVEFGFSQFELKRIYAHHLSRNPASGRVLLKTGFMWVGSGRETCGYRQHEEGVEFYEIHQSGGPF